MPALSDDSAGVLNSLIREALVSVVREIVRDKLREHALKKDIRAAIKDLEQTEGCEYSAIGFNSTAGARSVVDNLRAQNVDYRVVATDHFILAPKDRANEVIESAKAIEAPYIVLEDKDLGPNDGVKYPGAVVEKVESLNARGEIGSDGKPVEWSAVRVEDPETGMLNEEYAQRIANGLTERRIANLQIDGCVIFPKDQRDDIIRAAEALVGTDVLLRDDAERSRRAEERSATPRQRELIEKILREGEISQDQYDRFIADPTFRSARELLNSVPEVVRPIHDESYEEIPARREASQREAGRDDAIIEGSFAAQRREDIGNTQTTAEYVQARPNTGDMDRSTPYGDQCDPAGAGDRDGDGIRDAAEDRDGDGIEDSDEIVPEDIQRDAKTLEDEMTATAAYLNGRTSPEVDRSVSLQQETR